jgi:hypothetical protein
MSDALKLRAEKVTQEVFDLLPALLTAFQVKAVTGLDDKELAEAVKCGQIATYQRPPRPERKRSYNKYTKASVGKLVGFKI